MQDNAMNETTDEAIDPLENEGPPVINSVNEVYRYINFNDSCIVILDELKPLMDDNGVFNLNIAIKEDIAVRYNSRRIWVNETLKRLVRLGIIMDLGMGRYYIDEDSETIALVERIRADDIEEVVFQITLKPKENLREFKLVSFN